MLIDIRALADHFLIALPNINRDHLKSVGGQMRLLGVELAPMTGAYELDGVCYGRRPVEALSEGVHYEGPRSSMVAASPRV